MASQPLRISMLITADASGVSAATGEARREVEGLGASAQTAATGLGALGAGNDQAAATATTAATAAGTARREVQNLGASARTAVTGLGALAAANDQAAAAAQRAAAAAIGQSQAETQLQRIVNAAVGVRPESSGSDYARRQADVEAYGAALDQLRAKYNPIYAASQAYERELTELNRALSLGAITAQEHGAALTQLNGRYTAAAAGAASFGASAGLARMQTSNLAFQFQDIGTMMASGQNPFILLAQQLPQVTMYGGQVNGIMGALKQTVAGLFSPLGLLTAGFVLAGSAAISYFTSASEDGADATQTIEEQNDLIARVASRWDDATPAIKAYNDELERQKDLEELIRAARILADRQFDELRGSRTGITGGDSPDSMFAFATGGINDMAVDLADLQQQISQIADPSAMSGLNDAFEELRDKIGDSTATADDAKRVQQQLLDIFATTGLTSVQDLAASFGDLAVQIARAREQANLFDGEANTLESRGGVGISPYAGGRGADPRTLVDDSYWEDRFFPAPEKAARQPRATRARKTDAERDAERYDQIVAQAERSIEMEMLEAQALGMTGEAADRLRITQELLNQARAAGIELGPEQVAELTALGATMAQVTAETQAQSDAMEQRRDIITDVIGGIRQAAEDGKITMQELLDISMRVLDRIIDKIQGDFIDALLNVSGAGGGSGLFGAISQLFGLGGGSVALPATAPIPTARPGFSEGGFTGWGNPRRVAGDVHEEEYVVSAPAVRTIGLGNLERMHQRAKSGRGFAEGGYTGGGGMMGGGMGGMHVTIGLAADAGLNIMPVVQQVSRREATGVLYEAGPQLVNAATQSTMSSIARGDADDTMSSRFGVEARARRLG